MNMKEVKKIIDDAFEREKMAKSNARKKAE